MTKNAKGKSLTVRFDERMLAEYHVAVELLGNRTTAADVHHHARLSIDKAKQRTSPEEFEDLVAAKIAEIQERSKIKASERRTTSAKGNAKPGARPATRKPRQPKTA